MITYLEALAADIAEAVADNSNEVVCEPSRITVVGAIEPAVPAGEDCPPAIWIWLDRIEDENAINPDSCVVNTLVTVSYRIDVCYQTTAEDETDEIHLTAAECLYGLMNVIWCHLVALKDEKTLMGLGTCDHVNLLPLQTGPRQGGTVSATGGVTFGYDCG